MVCINDSHWLDLQLLRSPIHSPVLSPGCSQEVKDAVAIKTAGPTVTSRGQCFTQLQQLLEISPSAFLLSIVFKILIICFSLHFHSLPLEELPWCVRKVWLSSVVLSFYRFGSLVWPLALLCGWGGISPGCKNRSPALSRSCWHSRLLSVSFFPESLDTHPVSANDSTPSSPTSSQIPGPSPLYFSCVCRGRGGVERMGEEGRWLGCISEPPIWRVLWGSHRRPPELDACGWKSEKLLGDGGLTALHFRGLDSVAEVMRT